MASSPPTWVDYKAAREWSGLSIEEYCTEASTSCNGLRSHARRDLVMCVCSNPEQEVAWIDWFRILSSGLDSSTSNIFV